MSTRNLKDANLKQTVALPNAANTVNTNGIDLGATTPFPTTEKFAVRLTIGTATGANNKNINAVIQDSADNSTFANIAGLGAPIKRSVDNNGAGHTESSIDVQLPPGTRRYIRASATGEANGGNSADGNLTVELLF